LPSQDYPGASTSDGTLQVWVDSASVHLRNLTGDRIAFTVYDRQTLLERNADRDSCMLKSVAQCPAIAAHGTILLSRRAAVSAHGYSDAIAVRYWRTQDSSSYPRSARILISPSK
ncbi:MAG: hypothetical protein M3081_13445, partial [Gemmatimonadota bacterium]|nr:hypothetical protein [Gemmatimonadota bacterium]